MRSSDTHTINDFDSTIDLSGIPVDTSSPVMITGATGYLGSWVTKGLLDAGVTVHAAVRDPQNTNKVAHLNRMAEQAPGTLRLFAGDLLQPGSYDQAMEGCTVVIHTASPFIRAVEDPQRDLIAPALQGTRNVLTGVGRTPSVTRVVLTSSIAAMYGDAADIEGYPGRILTETCWNTTSSLSHEPYPYSKTLAEKEAWRLAAEQDRWRLVTINPSMILGPSLGSAPTSDSFSTIRMMIDGTARLGAPRVGISVVDVREVAQAHIAAAFLPEAHGRYIASAEDTDIFALTSTLLPRFGRSLPLPRRALPRPVVVAMAPRLGQTRTYIRRNVGYTVRSDASRSRLELGTRYRPVQASLEEMVEQMLPELGGRGVTGRGADDAGRLGTFRRAGAGGASARATGRGPARSGPDVRPDGATPPPTARGRAPPGRRGAWQPGQPARAGRASPPGRAAPAASRLRLGYAHLPAA